MSMRVGINVGHFRDERPERFAGPGPDRHGHRRRHPRPLSGGRLVLGIGASGPEVAEGC
jgi:hypothetical protein